MVNSKDPWKIALRDWGLWLLQMIPAIKRWVELGPRMAGRMQYKYEPGMAFMPELCGGAMFSQSFCTSLHNLDGQQPNVSFSDDVIFSDGKQGLFQIVVLMETPFGGVKAYQDTLRGLDKISPHLHPAEASFFVRNEADLAYSDKSSADDGQIFRIATAEEFASSPLCSGRPYPHGYREDDMYVGVRWNKFVIVRSDRFVFAACNTRKELETAARRLGELFPV